MLSEAKHLLLQLLLPFSGLVPHRAPMYYVYLLASRTRVLYVGVTNDISKRVLQHRDPQNTGFTGKYRVHRLVYLETYSNVRVAIHREKTIKGWTRAKKIALIEQENPTWEDIAEGWGKQMLRCAQHDASRK